MKNSRLLLFLSLVLMMAAPLAFGETLTEMPDAAAITATSQPAGTTKVKASQKSPEAPALLPMKAVFESKTVEAGDTVNLQLSFTLPKKAKLDDPPKIGGLPEGGPVSVKKSDAGLSVALIADTLRTFRVGPLTLEFTDKEGKRRTFVSEPAVISVTASLASDPSAQSPRPVKELLPVGFAYKKQVLWACGIISALLAAFFIWRIVARRKNRKLIIHTIAPDEAALSALFALDGDDSLSSKEFAFRLSAILRTYMESLRNFPAAEMTFEEISSKCADPADREILPILRATDLVKFAEHLPTAKDREEQTARVRAYVNLTRPRPEHEETTSVTREAAP